MFLFKIVLASQGPLRFHMNLKIGFSTPVTKAVGILKMIALNLSTVWGSIAILTRLIHRYTAFFHLFKSLVSFSSVSKFFFIV